MEFLICSTHFSRVSFSLTFYNLTGASNIRLALFFLASLKNFKKYLVLISSKQISKNFVH